MWADLVQNPLETYKIRLYDLPTKEKEKALKVLILRYFQGFCSLRMTGLEPVVKHL